MPGRRPDDCQRIDDPWRVSLASDPDAHVAALRVARRFAREWSPAVPADEFESAAWLAVAIAAATYARGGGAPIDWTHWLRRTVRSRLWSLIGSWRRQLGSPGAFGSDERPDPADPGDGQADADYRDLLAVVASGMTGAQAEAFLAVFSPEGSGCYREAARAMGCNANNVHKHVKAGLRRSRARERFEALLSPR